MNLISFTIFLELWLNMRYLGKKDMTPYHLTFYKFNNLISTHFLFEIAIYVTCPHALCLCAFISDMHYLFLSNAKISWRSICFSGIAFSTHLN